MTDDIPEDVMAVAWARYRAATWMPVRQMGDDLKVVAKAAVEDIARAILAEREACANIADSMECMTCIAKTNGGDDSKIAQAIRSRK